MDVISNSQLWVSSKSDQSAQRRNVLISGAARGIGRTLARHFLQKNHRVFLLDINEDELKHTCTRHLAEHSDRLAYTTCNLRNIKEIRMAVLKAVEFFPDHRIDLLINNGGIAAPYWKDGKSMDDPDTLDQWIAYVETNLTAAFVMSQTVIPHMKIPEEYQSRHQEGGGPSIIHISSFRAHQSDPNQEGYAATKAGLLGLTHSMAMTCSKWGIRVNLIAPGRINVEHEDQEGDEQGKKWTVSEEDKEIHAVNRAGKPEDIAEAAEYLMNASFVTGQDLTVDGGASKAKGPA